MVRFAAKLYKEYKYSGTVPFYKQGNWTDVGWRKNQIGLHSGDLVCLQGNPQSQERVFVGKLIRTNKFCQKRLFRRIVNLPAMRSVIVISPQLLFCYHCFCHKMWFCYNCYFVIVVFATRAASSADHNGPFHDQGLFFIHALSWFGHKARQRGGGPREGG